MRRNDPIGILIAGLLLGCTACLCAGDPQYQDPNPRGAARGNQRGHQPRPGLVHSTEYHRPGQDELQQVQITRAGRDQWLMGPPLTLKTDSRLEPALQEARPAGSKKVRLSGDISPCGRLYLIQTQKKTLLVKLPLMGGEDYAGESVLEGRLTRDAKILERSRGACTQAAKSPALFVVESAIVRRGRQ